MVILSARSTPEPIEEFLASLDMKGIEIKALDNANPKVKAAWIDQWIREHGLEYVEFFDDSPKNIEAVRQLQEMHPGVHIITHHVTHAKPVQR